MLRTCFFPARSILMYLLLQSITAMTVQANTSATASVQNIRYWKTSDSIRVVIDLNTEVCHKTAQLTDPDRIVFDLSNARLDREFSSKTISVADELLKKIRTAQNQPDVVRVVLDLSVAAPYVVSKLQHPFRIVIDLQVPPGPRVQKGQLPYGFEPSHVGTGSSPHLEIPGEAVPAPIPRAVGDSTVASATTASGPSGADGRSAVKIQESRISVKAGAGSGPDSALEPEQPYPALLSEAIDRPVEAHKPLSPSPVLPGITSSIITEPSEESRDLPLTVDGTLSTGYYRSFTRGGGNGNQNIGFVPAVANMNINGYYLKPDLLDYSVQTEFNAGSQASEAGFVGGNGLHLNLTALRRGVVPVTFSYSNLQLKDAYFGSLTQISSYTLKNRIKNLGVTAGLRLPGLPTATMDWGGDSVRSQSYNSALPEYDSSSNHLNVNCADQRWGWDFQCFAGRQRQTSDLFTPQLEQSASSLLRQNVTQYRASARRGFLADSDLYLDGGSQHTENVMLDRPIDLTTRYLNANLRMFQTKRWKTSLRAGYSSNIAGLLLTQLVGGLEGNGSLAPDSSILQPFRRKTSYLNINGLTSMDLSRGLSVYGSMERTAVFTAGGSDLDSRYFRTTGGANYSRTFRWGSVSGQYGRTLGGGTVSGQTGRVSGQNFLVAAQPGKPDGILFDFSLHGTSQSIRSEIPAWEHSLAAEAGIGVPVFGQYHVRIGGGWQNGAFTSQGNEFSSEGYTARLGLDHPRFQLNGSLNSNIGNSLQNYGQIFNGIGVASSFLGSFRMVPSDLRAVTVTVHIVPVRKLELSGLFTHSVQHLEGIVANDFEVIDVYATYHFRKLQLVVGYFNSSQLYSSYLAIYPETQRGRFYVRLSRPVKFL